MSASLVRKSLAIVDEDYNTKKAPKKKSIKNLIPENHKIIKRINRRGQKAKVELLKNETKLTISDVRKAYKSKEQILKENLEKLKLIQEICTVDLDNNVTEQIIKRAVTRRPVPLNSNEKKIEETVFTEEDFAKFEAEYFDE